MEPSDMRELTKAGLARALALLALVPACAVQQLGLGSDDAGSPVEHVISGRYCTEKPEPAGFTTNVLLLLENGAAQCAVDPQRVGDAGTACPPLPLTGPGLAARTRLFADLAAQPLASARVIAIPFSTDPSMVSLINNAPPDPALLERVAAGAQGPSDYEGALEHARGIIERDITSIPVPTWFARTRYRVVLVGTGLPGFRCAPAGATTSDAPGVLETWPSFDAARCADPQGTPRSHVGGAPRNQPAALVEAARALKRLGERYHASVEVHAIQLFDEAGLEACGAACAATQPWLRASGGRAWSAREQRETGRALLARIAEAGGGSLIEARSAAELATVAVPPRLLETGLSVNVLKSLVLVPLSSTVGVEAPRLDTDGDGVPDDEEPGAAALSPDVDGDCFADGVERRLASAFGFDPLKPDPRGCDPQSPLTPNCACRDPDGDGMSNFEEDYFLPWRENVSLFGQVDSDADGLPDGVELTNLLQPAVPLARDRDTDGDGAPDFDEVLARTDVRARDEAYRRRHGVRTSVTLSGTPDENGRVCYDFELRNVPLVATPSGLNRFLLYAAEAPQSRVAEDPGLWRAACLYVDRPTDETTARTITLPQDEFGSPPDARARCKEATP